MTNPKKFSWFGVALFVMWLPTITYLDPLPTTSIQALRSLYLAQYVPATSEINGKGAAVLTEE